MRKIEERRNKNSKQNNDDLKFEIKPKYTNMKKRKVKTWTSEQDKLLLQLYEQYPKKWGIIANSMKHRNENQCLHRYRRLSQVGVQRKIWSTEEDEAVLNLIKSVGKNWKMLSELLGTKTGKQIRQRFINKLDPKIKVQDWTEDEDRLILKHYTQLGSRWSQISKQIPGRPQNKIKNRFYSYISKNYEVKYINKPAEDKSAGQILPETEQIPHEQQIKRKIQKSKQKRRGSNSSSASQKKQQNKKQVSYLRELEELQPLDRYYSSTHQNNHNHNIQIQSLIKVDDQLPRITQNRYQSIQSLSDNSDNNQSQNDLFYLLNR